MKIYDVTLTIHEGIPVWPGDDEVILQRRAKIEEGAHANVSFLSLSAHTGTHVDAPYHFYANGTKVHEMPLEVLLGPVLVVEVPVSTQVINSDAIRALSIPGGTERLIFKTRNSQYWDEKTNAFKTDFLGVDASGAKQLVEMGIKLVGIDYLSISPYKISKPTHDALLGADMVIIEGLDLRQVEAGVYNLHCLPLKLFGADGAPARVILTKD